MLCLTEYVTWISVTDPVNGNLIPSEKTQSLEHSFASSSYPTSFLKQFWILWKRSLVCTGRDIVSLCALNKFPTIFFSTFNGPLCNNDNNQNLFLSLSTDFSAFPRGSEIPGENAAGTSVNTKP